jgi:hypothetical protein
MTIASAGREDRWLPLRPIDDGVAELSEAIVLRIENPTNGLQLGPRNRTAATLKNSSTTCLLKWRDGMAPRDLPEYGPGLVPVLRRGDREVSTAPA